MTNRLVRTSSPPTDNAGSWQPFLDELRELAWLSSMIAILSIVGVGLAVALALTLEGYASWSGLVSV
jgi:hypothetical protein